MEFDYLAYTMSMSTAPPPPQSTRICFCHAVADTEILKAIHEKGARSLEDIQRLTLASTGCGGCMPEVERILHEELAKDELAKEESTKITDNEKKSA